MQVQQVHSGQLVGYAITAVVVVGLMAFRMQRMSRLRPLKLGSLWVVPAIYLFYAVAALVVRPPVGLTWMFCGLALLVGAALGWQRGKMMHIAIDPETQALNQKASPAAMLFLIILIVIRSSASALVQAGTIHVDVATLTDILVMFALGMFGVTRLEMYIRAKRMLEEARA